MRSITTSMSEEKILESADNHLLRIVSTQGFDEWQHVVTSTYGGLNSTVQKNTRFSGTLSLTKIGRCELSGVESAPVTYRRTREHISHAPNDSFFLSWKASGSCVAEQGGRQALLAAGDLVLYDATEPYRLNFQDPYQELVLKIPRAALASRVEFPEGLTAVTLSARRPMARLVGSYLRELSHEVDHMSPTTRDRLDVTILDVVALALADTAGVLGVDEQSEALRRAKDFMRANLSDSTLNTARVAAELHMSPRTLNRLFAQGGESVMRWLLNERLRAGHRCLVEARARSVADAASEHGFVDLSHFSRVFKAKFGVSPSQVKNGSNGPTDRVADIR